MVTTQPAAISSRNHFPAPCHAPVAELLELGETNKGTVPGNSGPMICSVVAESAGVPERDITGKGVLQAKLRFDPGAGAPAQLAALIGPGEQTRHRRA